jgi:hypothetical protein
MSSSVHELRTIRADLASALQKVDRLLRRSLQGVESLGPEDVRELSMARAIEWTLANSREIMTPAGIWQSLRELGRTDRFDSLSVTTSDLASKGRVEKVARGKYRAWPK